MKLLPILLLLRKLTSSFIPREGGWREKGMADFMYQNILIQLVNAISFAWIAANSLEETPQAFWEARARFIPVSVLCHGRWALSAVNNLQMEGGRGKAGQHLRQSWFIRSKIKCLQGLTQVFSDEATLRFPTEGYTVSNHLWKCFEKYIQREMKWCCLTKWWKNSN